MTSTHENPAISSKPSSCLPRAKLISTPQSPPNHHTLLLLSDSALPLGSFAFSSGLESHLAHNTSSSSLLGIPRPPPSTLLPHFLSLSLHSLCTTSLPHLLAAHSHPQHITEIDIIFDACTLCPVARRASIAQGRALLTLWDRALRSTTPSSSSSSSSGGGGGGGGSLDDYDYNDDDRQSRPQLQQQQQQEYSKNNPSGEGEEDEKEEEEERRKRRSIYTDKVARDELAKFSLALKKTSTTSATATATTTTTTTSTNDDETWEAFFEENQDQDQDQQHHYNHNYLEAPSGHFPPLWGLVTRALHISARDSVYVFLLNHAKSVISAAVRASVMGPYQAQGFLGSVWLRRELERLVGRGLEEYEEEEEGGGGEEKRGGEKHGGGWRRRVDEAGQGVPALDIWLGRHDLLYSRIFNS